MGLKVEDYFPQKKRSLLRLREKNDKVNEMPCHHKLEQYLDAYIYIKVVGIDEDPKGAAVPCRNWKNQDARGGADVADGCLGYGAPPG